MNELKRTLAQRFPSLGESEYLLAHHLAEEKTEPALAELIDAHRAKFTPSNGSIAAGVFLSSDAWKEVYPQSEQAARDELLSSSAVLSELDELERKARQTQAAAEQKNREVNELWNEYNSIPERIQAREALLAQLGNEIRSLDPQTLKDEFKSLYSSMLDGVIASGSFLPEIAVRLYTSNLRLEVLNAKSEALQREVAELKARSKVLSRKLGQRK